MMMRRVVLLLFTFSPCSVYAMETKQHVLRSVSVSDPNPTTTEATCTYLAGDFTTEKHDGVCTPEEDCTEERRDYTHAQEKEGWYVIEPSSLTLFFL